MRGVRGEELEAWGIVKRGGDLKVVTGQALGTLLKCGGQSVDLSYLGVICISSFIVTMI